MLTDAADSQLANVDGCIADDFAADDDDVDEEDRFVEVHHRHFDAFMEQEPKHNNRGQSRTIGICS
jgi:hypothetical protein